MYFHAKEQALEYAYAVLRYHSSEKLVISFILTYLKNLTLLCGFPCNEKKKFNSANLEAPFGGFI